MYKKLFRNKYRVSSCRLPRWDYSKNGYYFITICTKNKINYFGDIKNGQIILSSIGKIVRQYWREIPKHFPFIILDQYIIMPNHIHGIIIVDKYNNDTCRDEAMPRLYHGKYVDMSKISPPPNSLPTIIGSFKSTCTKKINIEHKQNNFAWQPRYYDHIIQNNIALNNIKQYIINNPINWKYNKKINS